ncbi:MAG: ABC transporter permease [Saprospiraceae bacterium]|nr:ABC transporter permease [Saprospiraceae bacterium]
MEKTTITPQGLSLFNYIKDIYRYRRILGAFTYRAFRAKYAQTILGLFWIILNPLVTLLILGIVFGRIAKMDTGGINPFVFTMVGLAGWTYFSKVVSSSTSLVIGAAPMIKKIYFPRILLPLSGVLVGLVELLVVILMTAVVLMVCGQKPSGNLVFYPCFIVLIILLSAGVSFIAGAAVVRYRDFQQVLPFLVRVGLYATPVAYSLQNVDAQYMLFFDLNPLTGIMEGLRWSVFGGSFPLLHVSVTLLWILVLWVGGLIYFSRVEKTIADIL